MSENNVCLAVSKFRMNGHLCFLNTRHRISLHSEQIDGTTTVFLHAVIDLHNKILHEPTCTAAASKQNPKKGK